ncbi:MAG: SEC-C domain-containing protein, partial [Actinomycetota bacterium]
LLASVGLEHRGEYVGPADTEWLPPGVVRDREDRAELAAMFGFEPCCHVAFDTVLDAWRWSIGVTDTEPDVADAAKALEHGEVTSAFITWFDMRGYDLIEVGSFFESLGERAGRHGAVPLERSAWIWFTEGDIESAIDNAQAALALDGDLREATIILGHVAAIKSDYTEALRLLRRSSPEDAWVELLERIFEPFPETARNEPCPCGSGRKYKVCCARDPRVSPIQRMNLLTHKVIAFVEIVQSAHLHYLSHIAASADERRDPNDIRGYLTDPFMVEIAALEGSLDLFAGLWGPLLTQDEADTIDLWRASTRALWEVSDEPGVPYVVLRDTRTGDTVTVYDETMTPDLHSGELLMGIVAPAFGEDRFLGNAMRVDIRHRDMTLKLFDEDPTDEDFALWFGLVTAPPMVQTTEGQNMVICRAVCEPVSTWETLARELDALFEQDEDTEEWVATFVNDAGETVLRGTLRREDSQLIVETMSEERFDDILGTLTGVTVIEESREPYVFPSPLGPGPRSEPVIEEPMDPETRAVLTEIMQQKEETWLDEEIPAFGGLTPRQAAADPTRRDDLIALLDSFGAPDGSHSMGFDPERLRRLLELD